MHLLTTEQLDKVDSLLRLLREAAQTLLEMPTFKAAHDVAACVEVLEGMFHVEQTQSPPRTTGNGSQSSNTEAKNANPRDRRDSDDHVYEPVDYQPTGLAPQEPGHYRPGRSGAVRSFQLALASQRRPTVPRGRFRGRTKRRR